MGLFHDTCMAIVDLRTGEALSGERLAAAEACLNVVEGGYPVHLTGARAEQALAAQGWGFCGHKVSKRARVCSKCGHGAPGGWVQCPQCGKWVGNESKYCPHCNHPLHPGERIDLAGGVWDRPAGVFAQRFEVGDVGRILKNGLQVQEGTVAILLDGGKVSHVLASGRHTPEGTLRTINWFGNPPPRSAVMVESGDVVVRLDFRDLRASDETPLGAMAELTLRFDTGRAADFVANFFKDAREMPLTALGERLQNEALSAVRDVCQAATIEDLVKDPERRPRFEDAVGGALKELLKRSGLELVRVGAVEFNGVGYEKLRAQYGDLEEKRRTLEFDKKALELMADEEMMKRLEARRRDELQIEDQETTAKREQALADYLAQLAQEKGLSELALANEMEIARKVARHELTQKDAELAAADELLRHQAEMTALSHAHGLTMAQKNYSREALLHDAETKAQLAAKTREEAVRDAQHAAEIAAIARGERVADVQTDTAVAAEQLKQVKLAEEGRRAEIDTEDYKANKGVETLRKLKEVKTNDMKARLEAIRGASAAEMAFVADDPALRAQLLQQELAKAQLAAEQAKAQTEAALSAEQLLARAAATSTAAADALAKIHTAEAGAAERVLEEMKRMTATQQAHDEAQWKRMAELAEKAIENQKTTIVQPVVPPAAPTTIVR